MVPADLFDAALSKNTEMIGNSFRTFQTYNDENKQLCRRVQQSLNPQSIAYLTCLNNLLRRKFEKDQGKERVTTANVRLGTLQKFIEHIFDGAFDTADYQDTFDELLSQQVGSSWCILCVPTLFAIDTKRGPHAQVFDGQRLKLDFPFWLHILQILRLCILSVFHVSISLCGMFLF